MAEPVDSQRVSERLQAIASEVEANLRDSTWPLEDGTIVEAADRGVWLDMEWLLARVGELEVERDRALGQLHYVSDDWRYVGRLRAAEARVEALSTALAEAIEWLDTDLAHAPDTVTSMADRDLVASWRAVLSTEGGK